AVRCPPPGPPGGRRSRPGPGSGCWSRRRCRSRRTRSCPGRCCSGWCWSRRPSAGTGGGRARGLAGWAPRALAGGAGGGGGGGSLGGAAVRRDGRALAMGLAGLVTLVLAGAAWLVAVALPNWERLRTALRIWPTVEYLGTPAAIAGRVGGYLAESHPARGGSVARRG